MELKPPPTLRILLPACIFGLLALIIAPILLRLVQAALRHQPSPELMILPMLMVTLWAAWAWCSHDRWRLMADDAGIVLRQGRHITRIAWHQVETCREEASPLERDGASWVTLRDSQGEVLLRWERSWFGHSKRSLHNFDLFTSFVQTKIAENESHK